jgi:hypothetical protein
MALKKHKFLSLFTGFTSLLIVGLWLITPSNLDIFIEKKDRFYEANQPFEIIFKHYETKHPYLDPAAIISVRIEDSSKSISLNILEVKSTPFNEKEHLTIMTFESPFSEVKTPFILDDSTLLITTKNHRLSFDWGRFGIYDDIPKNSDLIQTLYGFYASDKPSLEGIYLALNVPEFYRLEKAIIGPYDIALNQIIQTNQPYIQGSKISEYSNKTDDNRSKFDQLILPFQSENTLEAVPIFLEYRFRYETFNIYLPPFRFIHSQPFLITSKMVQGVYHD